MFVKESVIQTRRRKRQQEQAKIMTKTRLCFLLLLFLLQGTIMTVVEAQECDANNPNRCDTHERCNVWREEGECLR